MDDAYPLYLIPLLPLLGAVVNLAVGGRLGKTFTAMVACVSVAAAMLVAWQAAWTIFDSGGALRDRFFDGDWFYASEQLAARTLHVKAGLLFDRLSGAMSLVVTTVGFLIHVYSTGYMEEDEGHGRYFAYLNLFTAAMLILVLGDSLPVTFVGWEGVGLCSYLLIGFWFTKEQNATAGRKAFIVNRIGDLGFLLGMFMIFAAASTLSYEDLAKPQAILGLRAPFALHGAYATFAALFLFIGATGKSAQLPLYVWLPDAMAGPTPVSALIHAATMVTAGVYMIARLHFLFAMDPFVPGLIAVVGALTALFAATMGVAQRPIKKILAYSTISQLGFMFVGVGVKAYSAGVFHLVTHAFFKAGLFLGAGAIMHALAGEEDVTKMGGLARKMPITRWTFLIYCLAIAGIVPFAGFFSKDAILAGAFAFDYQHLPRWPHWLGPAIYGVCLFSALLTSFYMFRAYFMVFAGSFRGDHHLYEHAHDPDSRMSVPLVVLAVGSVVVGFLGLPSFGGVLDGRNFVHHWLGRVVPLHVEPHGATELALMGAATVVAVAGIAVAWWLYGRATLPAVEKGQIAEAGFAYRLVANKYYVDELYDRAIVRPLRGLAWLLWKVVDSFFIDLVWVRGSAMVVDMVGRMLRYMQNGDAQRYVVGFVIGLAGIVAVASNWAACSASSFEVDVDGLGVTVRGKGMGPGPDVRALEYAFDFGDGAKETGQTAQHRYATPGEKKITVTVTDPRWKTVSRATRRVVLK